MHPNCQTVLFVLFRDQLQRRRLIYMTFVTKRLTFVKLERHARNTLFNKIFPSNILFCNKAGDPPKGLAVAPSVPCRKEEGQPGGCP